MTLCRLISLKGCPSYFYLSFVVLPHNKRPLLRQKNNFYPPPHLLSKAKRSFTMYVRFPKDMWSEIRKAEDLTPEGDMVFESFYEELLVEYVVG